MGATSSQCRLDRAECTPCKGAEVLWKDDGAMECIGDDLDGDVKDSQALINHKLLKAAREGDIQHLERSLAQGAYMETRRPFVMTPESTATPNSSLQTRGIGLTPLMYAAQNGYPQACEVLLAKGACVNAEDEDGLRPLHFAASSGSEDTCRILLVYGAEAEACDDDGQMAVDHVPQNLMMTQAEKKYWTSILQTPSPEEIRAAKDKAKSSDDQH